MLQAHKSKTYYDKYVKIAVGQLHHDPFTYYHTA